MKKIPLLFSDVSFGTNEYGFLPRKDGEDCDDEDVRYIRHVKKQFSHLEVKCYDGYLYVKEKSE